MLIKLQIFQGSCNLGDYFFVDGWKSKKIDTA